MLAVPSWTVQVIANEKTLPIILSPSSTVHELKQAVRV
jgi:hypothetical protein